jgi:hypothetical protein
MRNRLRASKRTYFYIKLFQASARNDIISKREIIEILPDSGMGYINFIIEEATVKGVLKRERRGIYRINREKLMERLRKIFGFPENSEIVLDEKPAMKDSRNREIVIKAVVRRGEHD